MHQLRICAVLYNIVMTYFQKLFSRNSKYERMLGYFILKLKFMISLFDKSRRRICHKSERLPTHLSTWRIHLKVNAGSADKMCYFVFICVVLLSTSRFLVPSGFGLPSLPLLGWLARICYQ